MMEKSSVIGIILGLLAVGVGMVLKGAHLSALINPAAFMIIIVGTAASVCIAFPTSELKKIPTLFKIIFRKPKMIDKRELIRQLSEWALTARREGLLTLEEKVLEIDDPFLKKGMQMIVDGGEASYVQQVLDEEIAAMEERHRAGALIFTQAGTYAPTLGVLGAVVGLVAALGNLKDIDQLGHSIAAAFIATLLGIFTGYVLWHPFANKLRRISQQEVEIKRIMMEGILSIQAGFLPNAIEEKLLVYLPMNERNLRPEEPSEERDND
jgi:chemotaxis protein MotA